MVAISATGFAVWDLRPSPTIRIAAFANGDFTCDSDECTASELKDAISGALAKRKRWFVDARAQVTLERGVQLKRATEVLSLVYAAGCNNVTLRPHKSG